VIATETIVKDQSHWDTRYDITSLAPDAERLSQAIRRHWGNENSRHRILDVAFGEDCRREAARSGAANLAAVRRLVNRILRQETP
jgi:predicted transposase YbfD/YdcC